MSNVKNILIGVVALIFIALMLTVVWLYKDREFQISEKERQEENVSQYRKSDTSKMTSQILTSPEIAEYLQYQNAELKKHLTAEGIKVKRIESIVSNAFKFRDTTKKETDVSGLVDAIKNSIPKEQRWSDTTKCLINSGSVLFDGQKLKVVVDDRVFENKSDAVAYWERRQWNFLGIKTRFLGKKVFTAKTFDECGESRIMKIEKKE